MLQLTSQFWNHVRNAKCGALMSVIVPLVKIVTSPAFTRLERKCFTGKNRNNCEEWSCVCRSF